MVDGTPLDKRAYGTLAESDAQLERVGAAMLTAILIGAAWAVRRLTR